MMDVLAVREGFAAQIPMRGSSKATQQSRLRRFLFVRIPAKASFAGLLTNKKPRYRGDFVGLLLR
jgi:hypothetical protein